MFDFSLLGLLFAVWWLSASFAVAWVAGKKGLSGGQWFVLSLLLGPAFSVLLLIAYPKEPVAAEDDSSDTLSVTGDPARE
jgi:hypothetical protein